MLYVKFMEYIENVILKILATHIKIPFYATVLTQLNIPLISSAKLLSMSTKCSKLLNTILSRTKHTFDFPYKVTQYVNKLF